MAGLKLPRPSQNPQREVVLLRQLILAAEAQARWVEFLLAGQVVEADLYPVRLLQGQLVRLLAAPPLSIPLPFGLQETEAGSGPEASVPE